MVDLIQLTEEHLKKYYPRETFTEIHLGRVKIKTYDVEWNNSSSQTSATPTRVVSLKNETSQGSTGSINIHKANKPVCTFKLDEGKVVREFPYRVAFKMPKVKNLPDVVSFRVNTNEKQNLLDYCQLNIKTDVKLEPKSGASANVDNVENKYVGTFQCNATLSGKVIVIKEDGRALEISVSNLTNLRSFTMSGVLEYELQDQHSIQFK